MTLVLIFIFGVCLGSFTNVLIFRIPNGKAVTGRSACMHCKKVLKPWELIPVLSFIIQGGRCNKCKKLLSWQYPLIEITSGLLFAVTFSILGMATTYEMLVSTVTSIALLLMLAIGVIDARTSTIPDALSIPLLVLGITASVLTDRLWILGILIGGGFFGLQWILSRGRVIGSGDIILGAGIGALLGDIRLLFVWLVIAYIAGGAIAAEMLLQKTKTLNNTVPFGPMLAGAGVVTVLWGNQIAVLLGL